ncbi:MAG: hypothetical protein A2091_01475 [Desulfuromonadales bacterium GWD2_61_12]|nr:MAG: hypothetical protein A2005_02615 [Desulfuromonadales bacterium GWC2_61_20]OGR35297.1 MAG: hypothetical protein A2091_01475 [Desulfuromonadales bacterium GWD2_61_12]HBT82152.1 hypothetical protein [Desulfuromonas sp.]
MKCKLLSILGLLLLCGCAATAPPWVTGKTDRYPDQAYLTGVGNGRDRTLAEDRARSEIAKVFQVDVRSRETLEESHWLVRGREGESSDYRQSASSDLTAASGRVLQGVRIAEVWQDPASGEFYALALLERMPLAASLRSVIADLDSKIAAQIELAEGQTTGLRQLGYYLRAYRLLQERLPLAGDLAVIASDGRIPPPPLASGEVVARADRIAAALHVEVQLAGDREGIVAGGLLSALAATGMQFGPSAVADLRVNGTVLSEISPATGAVIWSLATARIDLKDATGQQLDHLDVSVREGSQSQERADRLARELLGRRLAERLIERIGAAGSDPRPSGR